MHCEYFTTDYFVGSSFGLHHNNLHGQYDALKLPGLTTKDWESDYFEDNQLWMRAHNREHHRNPNTVDYDHEDFRFLYRASDRMRKHWYHKLAPVTSVLFLAHVDYILVISHSRILEFLIPGVLEGPYNGKSYRSKEVQEAFGQVFHKVKKDLWRAKFSHLFPQVLLGNLIARAIGYLLSTAEQN